MKRNYGSNDYEDFLANSYDEHTLAELIDHLTGIGYEGTSMEGYIREGNIAGQYELIRNGKATILYDTFSDEKVFLSGNGLSSFLGVARKKLDEYCGGMDYDALCAFNHAMEKD